MLPISKFAPREFSAVLEGSWPAALGSRDPWPWPWCVECPWPMVTPSTDWKKQKKEKTNLKTFFYNFVFPYFSISDAKFAYFWSENRIPHAKLYIFWLPDMKIIFLMSFVTFGIFHQTLVFRLLNLQYFTSIFILILIFLGLSKYGKQ